MSQSTALTTAKRNLIRQAIRSMPTSRLVIMLASDQATQTFLRDHVPSQHRGDIQWAVQSLSDELDLRVPAPTALVRTAPAPLPSVTPVTATPVEGALESAASVAHAEGDPGLGLAES